MVQRNNNMSKLKAGYLFPEINKRKQAYLQLNPNAQLISLGIGDTTQPISNHITSGLSNCAQKLSTSSGYTGYGPEQGNTDLRQKIAEVLYQNSIPAEDVFISDGSKCDISRLLVLFGSETTIAVQDPTYPAYVDSSIIAGQRNIVYMRCDPSNHFFPDLKTVPRTDIIFFCSPNNPTGATATHFQLEQLVKFAQRNKSIIIFDAAYSIYIRDPQLPKSIYEIPGANEVAIELGSFSKMAGFTGVRLGWSVVPEKLKFEDGSSVKKDWNRLISTCFNGASNISQSGGLSALENSGLIEMNLMVNYYLENAEILRSVFSELGYKVYGGCDAPYVWVNFETNNSWDVFEDLLQKTQIVATPGSGFGPAGEGFMRFSAFGSRASVEEAAKRILDCYAQVASQI